MNKLSKTLGMLALLLSLRGIHAFEPSEIAGLQLWLDADDASSVTLEADNKVSQWADGSGNDRHAVEGSSGAQPVYVTEALYGRAVLRLAGSQSLQSPYSQLGVSGTAHSFFAVSHPEEATGYLVHAHGSVSSRDSQSFSVLYFSNGNLSIPLGGSFEETPYDAEPQIVSAVWDRTEETAAKLLNGTVIDTGIGSATSSNPLNIGKRDGGANFAGDIAEIIIYNAALSETDRQTVEGYLAHKWGIADALPETHPHKTNPPGDYLPAPPFTLADIETGSEAFTNSNEVEIVDFSIPEGYDWFQITESGDIGVLDPNGWELTNAVPGQTDYAQPTVDTNITLYAWFTNETEAVTLRRAEGAIYYTAEAPVPSPLGAVTRTRLPGQPVVVMPEEIDDGSSGGEAGGQSMAIHTMWLTLDDGPDTDAAPDDPWVTVSATGTYTLSLTVMNEAGNVAVSAETCTLTVEPYDGQFTWTGAGDGIDWYDPLNWDTGVLPPAGEAVMITNGATVRLTNATPALASLTMSGGVLTVAGWESAIRATNMTASGGTIRPEGPFSIGNESRVLIECVDFHLGEEAQIDGKGRGYAENQGPGLGSGGRAGASHGGIGSPGNDEAHYVAARYGEVHAPTDPGSGSRHTDSGGGAVRIIASGSVTIDGVIDVDALDTNASHARGGAGGSIYITCATFHGDGGHLTARGGRGNRSGGSGGGGRIAVHYQSAQQLLLPEPIPDVGFNVQGARGGSSQRGGNQGGRHGTLSFPDMLFFESGILDTRWDYVEVHIPDVPEWTFPLLDVSGRIAFPEFNPLVVSGDVILRGDGSLTVHGGPTNSVNPYLPSVQMLVGGNLTLTDDATLILECDPDEGGVPYIECENLFVGSDAVISANYRGYDFSLGHGYAGPAPGESSNPGAAYGGASGTRPEDTPILPYGSAYAPVVPGSGGGGSRGGGLIWIGARRLMRVDGTLAANAYPNNYSSFGPPTRSMGSGGGILLNAGNFEGDGGRIYARGGGFHDITTRGPGAGGRIAVWTPYVPPLMFVRMAQGRQQHIDLVVDFEHPDSEEVTITDWENFTGEACVRAGVLGLENAEHGTIVFGRILFGTLIKLR